MVYKTSPCKVVCKLKLNKPKMAYSPDAFSKDLRETRQRLERLKRDKAETRETRERQERDGANPNGLT